MPEENQQNKQPEGDTQQPAQQEPSTEPSAQPTQPPQEPQQSPPEAGTSSTEEPEDIFAKPEQAPSPPEPATGTPPEPAPSEEPTPTPTEPPTTEPPAEAPPVPESTPPPAPEPSPPAEAETPPQTPPAEGVPAPPEEPTPTPTTEPPTTEPPAAEEPSPEPAPPEPTTEPPAEQELETPELAKKEIIQEADEGEASAGEKIYAMPEKFKKMKPKLKGGKGKKKFLILGILIILLLAGGGLSFYFWTKSYYEQPQEPLAEEEVTEEEIVQEEVVEEEVTEEEIVQEEPVLSPEQTLKVELKDEEEAIVASAEFYLPEGAIDSETQIELTGSLMTEEMKEQTKFKESSYEVIGALYTFSSVDVVLNKSTTLTAFYNEELIEEKWEQDLSLGYFKDDLWTPLESSLDTENNILSIDFDILPSDTVAIIVDKEKLTPKVEEFQIAPNIPSSTDSDSDGLTDVEESVFSTEVNNPDSDADGNPDGQEIVGLMHPLSSDEAKLAMSGLINVYTNPTFSYSFFYPSLWLARALPETNNQEVLVITNTGEFFSVTVENNPERLSAVDWYLRQSPNTDETLLYETIVNNQSAVWNPDRLTIYIIKEDRVYILSYNVGTEKQANFKTVFEMVINSFQFVVQPQGRADGTLIKYLDLPGVYLIENGKKRPFKSGEIFERIGFKWENVIEILITETYADGEQITGRLDGTLIKYPDSAGVYLIESGKKRSFKSGELFETLGYKWEDVIEILADETYPDGPVIESTITTTPTVE